jgi:DHA3 family macrolide efflux protein-like MFS transporter
MIGWAPAEWFAAVVIGRALVGFMMPIANGPIHAILQARVAPEIQGRVFTLAGSLSGLMMPLGLIIAAPVADYLGLRIWYWVGGIACMLIGLIFAFTPAILSIDQQPARAAVAVDGD